jgi:two-component system, OmpR family, response regulator
VTLANLSTPEPSSPELTGRPSVLLVEDDQDVAREILSHLRQEGYEAIHAATGVQGLEAMRTCTASLLIADRMLPGLDGLALIAALRAEGIAVPVLVLSALGSVDERIRGLKAGGDDYLVKPFAMGELFARIEALLRRPVETRETVLTVGSLKMDLIERSVRRGARDVELLPREFKLLEYMMRRPGQTVTRAMLFEDVWNYSFTPHSNLVDVHMGRLRHKIDGPSDIPMVRSVHGIGFVLHAVS